MTRQRALIAIWWLYAAVAVYFGYQGYERLLGPHAEPPFARYHGADFGGFYTGATAAYRGTLGLFGDPCVQHALQHSIQVKEHTGWKWFDPLPHPPALSMITMPISLLPLRTAYWIWVCLSFAAAAISAWLLARAFCPKVAIPAVIIMLGFEPLWHLVWWGQVDALILLPFSIGVSKLVRATTPRDEFRAGLFFGCLALIPQYAIVPLITLLIGRRQAARGMLLTSALLALASFLAIGVDGVNRYIDFYRDFGALGQTGTTVTERAMFNIRGIAVRAHLDVTDHTLLVGILATSIAVGLLTAVAAGRAIRPGRALDLGLSAMTIGTLLSAYHTHRQTLVFFFLVFCALIGRSLTARSVPAAILWATPVVGFHAATGILRARYPISRYAIQTYLAPVALGALFLLCLLLLLPWTSRRPWNVGLEQAPSAIDQDESQPDTSSRLGLPHVGGIG